MCENVALLNLYLPAHASQGVSSAPVSPLSWEQAGSPSSSLHPMLADSHAVASSAPLQLQQPAQQASPAPPHVSMALGAFGSQQNLAAAAGLQAPEHGEHTVGGEVAAAMDWEPAGAAPAVLQPPAPAEPAHSQPALQAATSFAAAQPAMIAEQAVQQEHIEAPAAGPVLAEGPFEAHLRAAEAGAVSAALPEEAPTASQPGAEAPAPVLATSASDPQPERERSHGELLRPHSSSGLEALVSRPIETAAAAAPVLPGTSTVAAPGPGKGGGLEEPMQAAGQQEQGRTPAEGDDGHGS